MPHIKFQEYLNSRKEVQAPKVKTIADYEGTVDHKPAKEKKHKHAGGKGQTGEPAPYKNGTNAKNPNKNEKGFADEGDKKLKYEPDVKVPAKVGEGGQKKASWPKTKMQEWIDTKKDLNLSDFVQKLKEEAKDCGCSLPNAKELINACKCSQKNMSSFVREMKRNEAFAGLFAEMMSHSEAYTLLAQLLESDESCEGKLILAYNEMVGPPMGPAGGDNPFMPKKKKKPLLGHNPDLDMGDDMDMDSPEDSDDMEGDDLDDMPTDDEMGDEEGGDEDMGGDEMGDDMPTDMDDMDDMDKAPHDKIMPPKKKKRGISDLLGAMHKHKMGMNPPMM